MAASHHLAQVNIGRIVAPLDDARLQGFVDGARARQRRRRRRPPGSCGACRTTMATPRRSRLFDDDLLLINLSVWESVEALRAFVYRSDHVEYLRRRRDWFEPMSEAFLALWWVPAGTVPTPHEAVDRVEHLRAHGPTRRGVHVPRAVPTAESPGTTGVTVRPDRFVGVGLGIDAEPPAGSGTARPASQSSMRRRWSPAMTAGTSAGSNQRQPAISTGSGRMAASAAVVVPTYTTISSGSPPGTGWT